MFPFGEKFETPGENWHYLALLFKAQKFIETTKGKDKKQLKPRLKPDGELRQNYDTTLLLKERLSLRFQEIILYSKRLQTIKGQRKTEC